MIVMRSPTRAAVLAEPAENLIDLRNPGFKCSANPEVLQAPFVKVSNDLLLKLVSFYVAAAIPGIGVGDVGFAENKQVIACFRLLCQMSEQWPGLAVIVPGEHVSGNRAGVTEKILA